jgi:transposase
MTAWKNFIGVDVSKEGLDIALMASDGTVLAQEKEINDPKALKKIIRKWERSMHVLPAECLACVEPTGRYSIIATATLVELKVPIWLVHPADVLKSLGNLRGKSDKVDALRLSEYGRRFFDKARLFTSDHLRTRELKELLTLREGFVKQKSSHDKQIKEVKRFCSKKYQQVHLSMHKAAVTLATKQIKRLDGLILQEIKQDPELHKLYDLLISVDGVGPVLAAHLIAITDGFQRFNDPKQLACHAGAAPFQYTSGTSIKGKTRVSKQAHPKLKSLLHMAALGVIQRAGELQHYYKRKRAEGKHAMLVLNAVRCKIIHRVCAVLKRGTPYISSKTLAHVIE